MKKLNYPSLIQRLVDFLVGIREQYPCEVDCNGEITYANGNDGTSFDWQCNWRLCEFGWGIPDGTKWAIKCLVYNDGKTKVLCYPNGELTPVAEITETLFSEDEAYELYRLMLNSADKKGLHDSTLDVIFGEG